MRNAKLPWFLAGACLIIAIFLFVGPGGKSSIIYIAGAALVLLASVNVLQALRIGQKRQRPWAVLRTRRQGGTVPEPTGREAFHVWWASATLTLSLILATASLTWNYPLFAQAAIGIAILWPLILLYKNLKSRRNASGTKDGNQARFYIIALAACWALIIVPMAYVALKGRGHPDWSDLTILVAIGASALTLAIIQGSIAARKSR